MNKQWNLRSSKQECFLYQWKIEGRENYSNDFVIVREGYEDQQEWVRNALSQDSPSELNKFLGELNPTSKLIAISIGQDVDRFRGFPIRYIKAAFFCRQRTNIELSSMRSLDTKT